MSKQILDCSGLACCAMLRYAVLYYDLIHDAMLCYVMLSRHAVQCHVILQSLAVTVGPAAIYRKETG